MTTQLDIDINAYLPSDYITDSMQKIEIYKKVVGVHSIEEADDLYDELLDRFGDLPQAVINLLTVARLKVYGHHYWIQSITQQNDELIVQMHSNQNERINGQRLLAISSKFEGRIKMMVGSHIKIALKCKGLTEEQALELLEKFLIKYKEAVKSEGELQHVGS